MDDVFEGVTGYYNNDSVDPRWGGVTKSGTKFDETKYTTAVLPEQWKKLKGKTLKVTSLDTGKSVNVLVNDTGGFAKYDRILDLSESAFKAIFPKNKGIGNVKVEVLK